MHGAQNARQTPQQRGHAAEERGCSFINAGRGEAAPGRQRGFRKEAWAALGAGPWATRGPVHPPGTPLCTSAWNGTFALSPEQPHAPPLQGPRLSDALGHVCTPVTQWR